MATNPQPRMTRLTARIDAAALAAFDAYAEGRGGRSAVLRQLISQAAKANGDAPHIEPPDGSASNRISLRFTDTELAVITHRASQRSTDRSRWIKALVRRHIFGVADLLDARRHRPGKGAGRRPRAGAQRAERHP